jgi:hypothetical protein
VETQTPNNTLFGSATTIRWLASSSMHVPQQHLEGWRCSLLARPTSGPPILGAGMSASSTPNTT